MKKNKEFRRMIAGTGIGILVLLLFFYIYCAQLSKKIADENYKTTALLLWELKKEYPDFDETAWIASLNNAKTAEKEGIVVLQQYGIFPGQFANVNLENCCQQFVAAGSIFLLLSAVFVTAMFWYYLNRRQKSLERLTQYVKRVEQGEYALELIENTEDELSSLKNELYTVTVMLKEHADIAKKQRVALADSVSDISHQLKTPLTSVVILLDNMSDDADMEAETRQRFLSEITRQINHVNWLVTALLKLSRLDAGVVEFSKAVLPLDDMLSQVMEKIEVMAEWKQITLTVKGETGIEIYADEHWILEAVTNIVKNAIEHSPEGSEVLLQKEDNAVYTAIKVTDYGVGMDEEECKHVFERFYRNRRAKEDSVGIGLSLAKEIVKQHGGNITVESKKACGTTFTIKLIKN